MANTVKFGNGQWATKVGSTLAYNDEGGNFKPLPFNFTRSTSGTRVNKDGLIEVVTNNKPRIDFLNDSNGALLLEPTRTNLITYSEDFSNAAWTKSVNTEISANATTSPDGTQNADTITWSTSGGTTQLYQVKSTTGTSQSLSLFVKYISGSGTNFLFSIGTIADASINLTFTNSGATLTGVAGVDVTSYKIEDYGNNWFRVSFAANYAAGSAEFNVYRPSGTGTDVYAIYGAQLESSASYATSYIPTQIGSISTRVAEVCTQTPPSGIIGQTEGTVFMEVEVLNGVGIQLGNSTSGGDYVNSIQFAITPSSTNAGAHVGGVSQFSSASVGRTGRQKIAVAYGLNNYALYINGTQIAVDLSATVPSMSTIIFNHIDLGTVNGEIKQTKLYNTRLTNAELQQLTTI